MCGWLEGQTSAELNLAASYRGAGDLQSILARSIGVIGLARLLVRSATVRILDGPGLQIAIRLAIAGMIEGIRCISTNLQLDLVMQGELLACGDIYEVEARSVELVPSLISEGSIGRKREGSRVCTTAGSNVLPQALCLRRG